MPIHSYQNDIFSHLEETDCQAIIVWGRRASAQITTSWIKFAQRYESMLPFFSTQTSPWYGNHSVPWEMEINGSKKYIYFLKNNEARDALPDDEYFELLNKAFCQFADIGVTHIAFNGCSPLGIRPVYFLADNTQMRKSTARTNERLINQRVQKTINFINEWQEKNKQTLTIDLVSTSEVFVNFFNKKNFYKSVSDL